MTKLLITLHVLAVIVAIGPVSVAVSLFPRHAKDAGSGVAAVLHRITKAYGTMAILVPIFGFAAAGALKVTDNQWVIESIILPAAAALVLWLVVIPAQKRALAAVTTDAPSQAGATDRLNARLAAGGGVFNLLWLVIVVLMVYRPGFHINK